MRPQWAAIKAGTFEDFNQPPLTGCDSSLSNASCVVPAISIHAPLTGCDGVAVTPRTLASGFQSTHPLRDATTALDPYLEQIAISIHAPLTGCDCGAYIGENGDDYFNPRTPYGMRRLRRTFYAGSLHFNPRTPYGMRPLCMTMCSWMIYFNPRTPYGMRRLLTGR